MGSNIGIADVSQMRTMAFALEAMRERIDKLESKPGARKAHKNLSLNRSVIPAQRRTKSRSKN